MGYNRLLVIVLTVMVCMAAAPALAAEELFDTATAAKLREQGISCLKAKDFDTAIKEFDESAAIAPEADAYYYLGYAYYMKGRKAADETARKKSLEYFEKAYEIDPNFSPTRSKPSGPAPQKTTTPPPEQPKP